MTSSGELLGTYPIQEVGVARVGSDRFDLQVGSERLVFTADDSLRFSYEAMPLIESARRRSPASTGRVRSWLSRLLADDSGDPEPDDERRSRASARVGEAFTPTRESPSLSDLRQDAVRRPTTEVARSMSSDAASEPSTPPGIPAGTCIGIRSDGKICGSAAVSERGLCSAHDPARHIDRRDVIEQTTRAAERVRRSALENLDDVVARLERAVAEVHEGRLDPQQALAMASLAQAMVETIGLAKSEKPGGAASDR